MNYEKEVAYETAEERPLSVVETHLMKINDQIETLERKLRLVVENPEEKLSDNKIDSHNQLTLELILIGDKIESLIKRITL